MLFPSVLIRKCNSHFTQVLEALSGIPFPRGSGLVTRCPIRLVMRKARADEVWHAYVSTSTNPSKRFPVTEVNALGSMIDRLTNSLIDGSSQFSTDSIVIDLVSPDASDLTVVDLPGIIRTVTAGQTTAVIDQVNKLIKSFLLDKRTIILAVIPANQVWYPLCPDRWTHIDEIFDALRISQQWISLREHKEWILSVRERWEC